VNTSTIIPVPVVSVALSLNFIAIAYKFDLRFVAFFGRFIVLFRVYFVCSLCCRSLAAIPFGTMIIILSLWIFISCPLAFAGTILGRHCTPQYEAPCRVSVIPRIIPVKNWRIPQPVVLLLAGSLSFGSVFIEMYVFSVLFSQVGSDLNTRYFVFTSFWNYKFYYVYGFVCLMLVILIVVVSCTSVVVV
jgi:transmembrane 9 superfamily protein 3